MAFFEETGNWALLQQLCFSWEKEESCLPWRISPLWHIEYVTAFCYKLGHCTKINCDCLAVGLLLLVPISVADSWILAGSLVSFRTGFAPCVYTLLWPWFNADPNPKGLLMSWKLGMFWDMLNEDHHEIPLFLTAVSVSTPHRCWERHVLALSQEWYHLPLAMLFPFLLSLGNTLTCLNSASTTRNGIIFLSKQTCGGWN